VDLLPAVRDVFSRYVPGWMVATRASAVLSERLIADTAAKQGIMPGQLTVHADRGSSMTSRPVALPLADLGIVRSHSRPHTSNDNPYSEGGFKTPKYAPSFPRALRLAGRTPGPSAGTSSPVTTSEDTRCDKRCRRPGWRPDPAVKVKTA
jgi:transposase InsO family protein